MRRLTTLFAVSTFLLVASVASFAMGQQGEHERFDALAVHLGTGPSGQAPVEIEITRWTTDEEGQQLLAVLEGGDHRKLADALGKEKETGFIRFPTIRSEFPSTRLHYARQFQRNGKRVVVLATNRPIGFLEVVNDGRSMDYNLTLIELELDADGNGTGVLGVGVDIGYDADKKQLVTKNWSSSPVQLKDVKKKN